MATIDFAIVRNTFSITGNGNDNKEEEEEEDEGKKNITNHERGPRK